MTALINRLPPELLIDIFWSTIPDVGRYAFGHTIWFTLGFCSVCSAWRQVVLNTPLFWSTIPIGNGEHLRNLAQLCIERSKDSLIDIVAHIHDESRGDDWHSQQELITHAYRIRSVDILANSHGQVSSLMKCILGDRVPGSLTHLSIRVRGWSRSSSLPSNPSPRQIPPEANITRLFARLHTLHLDNVDIPEWAQWEGCSFGELRELVLSGEFMGYEGVSDFMTTASNLRLLEFRDSVEWAADSSALKTVLKPVQGSKILRIHKVPHKMLRPGMDWIVPGKWETELILDTRFRFDQVVSATVTALSLDNHKGNHSGSSIYQMLATLPNLETLTLEKFDLTHPVLFGLKRSSHQVERPFPQLSVLRLNSSHVLDSTGFKAVITDHPLRRLEIWSCELGWDGENKPYVPITSSPLYLWLRERVPEVYIVGPLDGISRK